MEEEATVIEMAYAMAEDMNDRSEEDQARAICAVADAIYAGEPADTHPIYLDVFEAVRKVGQKHGFLLA